MDAVLKKAIMDRASDYLQSGWHCSEGILLAAGQHYFPGEVPGLIRIAAPFSGGVGGTQEELCGAFAGGLMVIGALYGRETAHENDDHCLELTNLFRERFLDHFGSLRCKNLREEWVGKPGQPDCAELTAQAVGILIDVIGGKKKQAQACFLDTNITDYFLGVATPQKMSASPKAPQTPPTILNAFVIRGSAVMAATCSISANPAPAGAAARFARSNPKLIQ